MLDNKRIKEAETNVRSYLQDGLLRKAACDKNILAILAGNAKESLRVADTVKELSDLWVIVCSYYAMYYYANAALLKQGYKVGEKIAHKVTADAVIVFVRDKLKAALIDDYELTLTEAMPLAGIKADGIIETLDREREKRSAIQYKTLDGEKHARALTSLQRAKEFAKEMEKLLV
jgi:uncharacterized protein (UPF0332 family)